MQAGNSRKHVSQRGLLCAAACLGALSGPATGAWPEKPIRMVVPYATGASADVSARQLIQKMSELLGQQVFADNRGGASGIVGTESVKKSAPDGYTIMYATAQTHAINKGLFDKLPYDPVSDFSAIGQIGRAHV